MDLRRLVSVTLVSTLAACVAEPSPSAPPPASVAAPPAEPAPEAVLRQEPKIVEGQDPLVVRMTPNRAEPHERQLYVQSGPDLEKWAPFLYSEDPAKNRVGIRTIKDTRPASVEVRTVGNVTVKEAQLLVKLLTDAGVPNVRVVLGPDAPPAETEPPAVLKERALAELRANPPPPPEVVEPPPGPLPSDLVETMERARLKPMRPLTGEP